MNLFDKFSKGLPYDGFLAKYASASQAKDWHDIHDLIHLRIAQKELLRTFRRQMNVLCLAGTWCGDCSSQCPIFDHFARSAPVIAMRYLDRDDHADVLQELRINGGNRVPVLVFFSEDGFEVARFGERTLSSYRSLMDDEFGSASIPGLAAPGESVHERIAQDWLNEFERVQLLLRLSPRLRQKHKD